jgi:hypothetical protein
MRRNWSDMATWTSPTSIRIASGLLIVVVLIGAGCSSPASSPAGQDPYAGRVTFSATVPTSSPCRVSAPVTSIQVGSTVYAAYHFRSKLSPVSLSYSIEKDGVTILPPTAIGSTDTTPYDCIANGMNLGALTLLSDPGSYKITVLSNGVTVAAGTLTVTAP